MAAQPKLPKRPRERHQRWNEVATLKERKSSRSQGNGRAQASQLRI